MRLDRFRAERFLAPALSNDRPIRPIDRSAAPIPTNSLAPFPVPFSLPRSLPQRPIALERRYTRRDRSMYILGVFIRLDDRRRDKYIHIYIGFVIPRFFFSTMFRDTVMAAPANSAHQERAGPRGPVPADVSGHHRPEAAHRDGRQQGRPLQVRQARPIGHQIEIGPSLPIQLPPAGPEGHNPADRRQTIAPGSCESLITSFIPGAFFFQKSKKRLVLLTAGSTFTSPS